MTAPTPPTDLRVGEKNPKTPTAWAYAWWAVTGALLGFSVVSLLTIGVFLLPVAAVLFVAGILWTALRNESAVAVVGGLAAAPLYIGWINRHGPGRVCDYNPVNDATHCAERFSPWPFAAIAFLLIAASIVAVVTMRGRRESHPIDPSNVLPDASIHLNPTADR